jgi:predicted nucleic acid-binding Zn ribbon protein
VDKFRQRWPSGSKTTLARITDLKNMECPNCGTWNPDDKKVCWRCQQPLPTPKEEKKKRKMPTIMGMSFWLFLLIVVMLAAPLIMSRCGAMPH